MPILWDTLLKLVPFCTGMNLIKLISLLLDGNRPIMSFQTMDSHNSLTSSLLLNIC